MLRNFMKTLRGEVATHDQVEAVHREVVEVKERVDNMSTASEDQKQEAEQFARDLSERLDRLAVQVNAVRPGADDLRRMS
jgi:hypothetical protein